MSRTLLVLTVAMVMAAMIALASPALAIGNPPPQADKGIITAICAGPDTSPPVEASEPTFCTN